MSLERWLHVVPLRIRSLFRRGAVEDELDEELRDHLERRTEEGIANGLSADEARRAALLDLGGIEQRKEECRDGRGVRWLEEFLQDLRYGFASCARIRRLAWLSSLPWHSGWARTWRCFRSSIPCCLGLFQFSTRSNWSF